MDYPYDEDAARVAAALEGACERLMRGRRIAVAFSGGLDSSLIAYFAKRSCEATLYVAGTKGCHDRKAARVASDALDMRIVEVEMDLETASSALEAIERAISSPVPIEVAIAVPLAHVCAKAGEEFVVTGAGADELFGGYARYARMPKSERQTAMAYDYDGVRRRGGPSESSLGKVFGKTIIQPYLDASVEDAVLKAPFEARFYGGARKSLLLAAALRAGLPPSIAETPKKAAQYGSGATRLLAKLAKAKNAAETDR